MPTPTRNIHPTIATDPVFDTYIHGQRVIVFPTDILGRKWLEMQLDRKKKKKSKKPIHPKRLHWNKSHAKPARNTVSRVVSQTLKKKR